jgi:voltage-gated potassium channel
MVPIPFLFVIWRFLRINTGVIRDPNVRPLAVWVAILLLAGTIFYRSVEGWGWLDSLYFCVISLATVGYGDLHPTTALSKLFTMAYVLSGVGLLLGFVDALFERGRNERFGNARRPRDASVQKAAHLESGENDTPTLGG